MVGLCCRHSESQTAGRKSTYVAKCPPKEALFVAYRQPSPAMFAASERGYSQQMAYGRQREWLARPAGTHGDFRLPMHSVELYKGHGNPDRGSPHRPILCFPVLRFWRPLAGRHFLLKCLRIRCGWFSNSPRKRGTVLSESDGNLWDGEVSHCGASHCYCMNHDAQCGTKPSAMTGVFPAMTFPMTRRATFMSARK